MVAKAAKAATTAAGSRNYVIATPTTASAAAKVDILQAADALDTVAVIEAALVIATTAAEAFAKAATAMAIMTVANKAAAIAAITMAATEATTNYNNNFHTREH